MKPLSKIIDFSDMQEKKYKYYTADNFKQFDILSDGVSDMFKIYQWRRKYVRENKAGVCPTLTANMGTGGHNVPLIKSAKGIRKLTTLECFELMGFTKEQHDRAAEVCSASQLYKQAGNSIVVDVLIELLTPIMKNFEGDTVRILELFGGIGAPRAALERMGYKVISDYVEIDKHAVASYNAIFLEREREQSVTDFNAVGKVYDLVFHGSPCQDFSIAGLMAGADQGSGTRSSLMWETVRIVNECRAGYVIWENVKAVLSNKHIDTFNKYIEQMEVLGYETAHKVINAVDCGIPQNRERLFATSKRSKNDN